MPKNNVMLERYLYRARFKKTNIETPFGAFFTYHPLLPVMDNPTVFFPSKSEEGHKSWDKSDLWANEMAA